MKRCRSRGQTNRLGREKSPRPAKGLGGFLVGAFFDAEPRSPRSRRGQPIALLVMTSMRLLPINFCLVHLKDGIVRKVHRL
jgi:hypothetical protein